MAWPDSTNCHAILPDIFEKLREKSLNLLAMPPHQPLRVQHAGTILLLVPRRPEPPAHLPGRLQPELQQPQQAHRHPLRLAGPLDRIGRPRPALLPAQPLLQVAEAVLLPEPSREQFHHLQPRQFYRRSHQGEPLLVSLDVGDDCLDRHLPPQYPPQADDLLPADRPLPSVDEGGPELPLRLPPAPLARRGQPLTPLGLLPPFPLGALLRGRGQGEQPGVATQAGEEVDPGRAACGQDQQPDHALQGVAAVENAQVFARDDADLLAEQLDGQFALGPERHDAVGPGRQLRPAEVEPAGDRQEPRGLLGLVEQGAQDHPVVGADGGGPIGAAGGVLVEGASPPNVGAGAMDLGVIDGRDTVAVPDPTRGGGDQVGQCPGDAVLVPGTVLGEGFQGLPGGGLLQGQDRLGDGVFLDVQRHGGDPLGEAVEAAAGEGPSEGVEQGLPDGPGELSFGHDASPVSGPDGSVTTWQIPTRRRGFQYCTPAQLLWSFSWKLLFIKNSISPVTWTALGTIAGGEVVSADQY